VFCIELLALLGIGIHGEYRPVRHAVSEALQGKDEITITEVSRENVDRLRMLLNATPGIMVKRILCDTWCEVVVGRI